MTAKRSVSVAIQQLPGAAAAAEYPLLRADAAALADGGGYPALRAFLQDPKLDKATLYGFFPADFATATGLGAAAVREFLDGVGSAPDVVIFPPRPDLQCLYASTIEQGETLAPGLGEFVRAACAEVLGVRLPPRVVMDARHSVVGHYLVAKPKFWRSWLAIAEHVRALAAKSGIAMNLRDLLVERIASLMLAMQPQWTVRVFGQFRFPFPADAWPGGAITADDLVRLDALKFVYREKQQHAYLEAFLAERERWLTPPVPVVAPSPPAPAQAPATIAELGVLGLLGQADALAKQSGPAAGAAIYREWLRLSNVARFNYGRMLTDIGDLAEAELAYRIALQQDPGFIQARLNLGSLHERNRHPAEAREEYRKAVEILRAQANPDPGMLTHALNNLGRLLEDDRQYAEAESVLTQSLAVRPDQTDVMHHWVHLRQKECAWPVYTPLPGVSVAALIEATSALAMLSASEDPALQLATARRFCENKVSRDLPPLAPAGGYAHDRLRIGYLSSNLGMHAVTILTAELYELHDRSRFEVYAFCWSPEDNTPMRARIRKAMDHLIRVDQMTDEQAAQAIRAAEIDILVDLQGLTSGCRANILAHRPAPLQVTWLGFPGPTGQPAIDYVIADRYLIPEHLAQYYSEKPLYLPDCFQVNDRKRPIGATPTRAKYGLPEDAFVFCAFNHNHKFTPELFERWMDILKRVPGSMLWLLADNETAKQNLTREALARGVEASRLSFAPRELPEDYLARYRIADLFLDTLPFNGGTTASDALWVGLPVLTCSGRSFASRMAGSLLQAIGLPELITTTFDDYTALAIALANDRPRLAALRARLAANRDTYPLFDTPRFVRNLEHALEGVAVRQPAAREASLKGEPA